MKPDKKTKAERIAELERKLREAEAAMVHNYHFADSDIGKLSTAHLMGSGVVITLTVLGGRRGIPPTLIRDGLSEATIAAIKADFVRSYQGATEFKPRGLTAKGVSHADTDIGIDRIKT